MINADDLATILERMEKGLALRFQWFAWNNNGPFVNADVSYCIKNKELAENFCWNPEKDPGSISYGVRMLPAYQALKKALLELEQKGELPEIIQVNLKGIEHINPFKSQRHFNYEILRDQLLDIHAWDNYSSHRLIEGLQNNEPFFQIIIPAAVDNDPLAVHLNLRQNAVGNYALENFHVTGIYIPHVFVKDVDTGKLEKMMQGIDWETPPYHAADLGKKDLVFLNLHKLRADPAGEEIARRLFLKYIEEPFRQHIPEVNIHLRSVEKLQTFPVKDGFTLTVEEACHLFAGRAVFHKVPGENLEKRNAWFILDPEQKDKRGNALLLQFDHSHNYDLARVLPEIPFSPARTPDELQEVAKILYAGGSVQANIIQDGEPVSAMLLANPLGQAINAGIQPGEQMMTFISGIQYPTPDKTKSPFMCAYDSQLQRQSHKTGHTAKEEILPPLNLDESQAAKLTRKR